MQNLFKIYRIMLAESAAFHEKEGNSQLATTFRLIQGKLRDLLNLKENREPVVAFVGLTNSGKSTLLSSLFGDKVAPACNRPWSSVPVEYRYSSQYEINAEFSNTIETSAEIFDSPDEMLAAIEKYVTAKENASTSILYAKMPSELLKDGLVIADTPGLGAATAAGGASHYASLLDYLPQVDYIFWVIKSLQGITKVELDFYNKFLQGRCDNIVVNCFEEFSLEEQKEFAKVNSTALPSRFNWHFVNAKMAMRGKNNNNNEEIIESGIRDFEHTILNLSPTEKRLNYLNNSIIKFFNDLQRFKRNRKERMFFVEHRRLQLMHELEKYSETNDIIEAMRHSIN